MKKKVSNLKASQRKINQVLAMLSHPYPKKHPETRSNVLNLMNHSLS
jgi:hypothetical protein